MKLRLNTPVDTDARPAPLTGRSTKQGRYTAITNADTRAPLPHSVNAVDPHENAAALREIVVTKVAALHAAGALDQDTLEVLSPEISSWLQTWTALAYRHSASRREVAQLLLAQTIQDLTDVTARLEVLRSHRDEIADVRIELLHRLGLPVPSVEALLNASSRTLPPSRVRALRASRVEDPPVPPTRSVSFAASSSTTEPSTLGSDSQAPALPDARPFPDAPSAVDKSDH